MKLILEHFSVVGLKSQTSCKLLSLEQKEQESYIKKCSLVWMNTMLVLSMIYLILVLLQKERYLQSTIMYRRGWLSSWANTQCIKQNQMEPVTNVARAADGAMASDGAALAYAAVLAEWRALAYGMDRAQKQCEIQQIGTQCRCSECSHSNRMRTSIWIWCRSGIICWRSNNNSMRLSSMNSNSYQWDRWIICWNSKNHSLIYHHWIYNRQLEIGKMMNPIQSKVKGRKSIQLWQRPQTC